MRTLRFEQQKPRPKSFPITRTCSNKQSCILCLEEMTTKQRLNYTTNVCACKPQIHDTCFDEWDKRNPGSCPICRKKGTVFIQSNIHNRRSVPVVSSDTEDMGGFCCILGCWSVINSINVFTS